MIQVDQNTDRGVALYGKYQKDITEYVKRCISEYFQSNVYKGIKNRCKLMDSMIDNNFKNTPSFISDVTPPVIRKSYLEFKAIFKKFLEPEPLFNIISDNKTPGSIIDPIQAILYDGMTKTDFRDKALKWLSDLAISHGTCGAYTYAVDNYNANSTTTEATDIGEIKQVVNQQGDKAIITVPIHACNCIVDPISNFMVQPMYQGFISDVPVSTLFTLRNNQNYIQDSLEKVLAKAKEGITNNHFYQGEGYEKQNGMVNNYSRYHASIYYLWMKLPFEGNEDDNTIYGVEMVGDEVIRIEVNPLDDNVVPFTTITLIPRRYTFAGNTPLEDKTSLQNSMNWLVNTWMESTMKLTDRLVLFNEGALDITAINNRHRMQGFVPVKSDETDLSSLIFTPQFSNSNSQEIQAMMRELRQQDQEQSPLPNLQNSYNQGGLNNKTLGGAQMVASMGDMLVSSIIDEFAVGLKQIARHRVMLHRAIADESQTMADGTVVNKNDLFKKFVPVISLCNFMNYQIEWTNITNVITQIANWQAAFPEMKGINMSRFITQWLRAVNKRENISDYVDMNYVQQMVEQKKQPPQPQQPEEKQPSFSISANAADLPQPAQQAFMEKTGLLPTPQAQPAQQNGQPSITAPAQGQPSIVGGNNV